MFFVLFCGGGGGGFFLFNFAHNIKRISHRFSSWNGVSSLEVLPTKTNDLGKWILTTRYATGTTRDGIGDEASLRGF